MKILCVDDVRDNVKLLEADLEDQGYETIAAYSGEEALALVASTMPDAIILDWMMPGLTGIEVLRRLRETFSMTELPIILATALSDVDNMVEAFEAGANDYVTKPIEMEVLLARLSAQLTIQRLTREREELAAMKDEFMAIASHDLKTPLSAILSFARLFRAQIEGDRFRKEVAVDTLRRVERGARTMIQIVRDFIDLDALEDERLDLNLESVDVAKVIQDILAGVEELAHEKKLSCKVTGPNLLIRSDVARLSQILENLIGNAIKFSPPETIVEVRGSELEEEVMIEVIDQGPGLSDHDLKCAFGKFQRLSAKPTGGEKSSGLGLYICKKIADWLGGEIGVRNNPDQGATFWIRLPKTLRASAS